MKGEAANEKMASIYRSDIAFVLLFVILVLVIPPLFHKEAGYGPGEDAEGDSFSTPERILCIDDNKEALIWRLRLIGAAKERIILTTLISEMRKADRI